MGVVASPRARAAVLVLLLAVGALLRGYGAGWGAPFNLHVDELAYNLHAAVRTEHHRHRDGWWRPEILSYGMIPVRAFVLVRDATMGRARAVRHLRAATTADDYLRAAYTFDPARRDAYHWPSLVRWLRLASALAYSLALGFTAATAWRLYGPRVGLVTALSAGFAAGLVQHAHYFTPEAPLTLGVAVLGYACARIATDRRGLDTLGPWADFMLAAAGMVLVTSSKITSGPVCAALGLAVYARLRDGGLGRGAAAARTLDTGKLWASVVLAVLAWGALNPAAVRHAAMYFAADTHFGPIEQVRAYRWGAELPDWASFYVGRGRTYFLRQTLADALGQPLALLGLAGTAALGVWGRGLAGRLPAVMAALLLAPLLMTQLQTIRYVVPGLGVLCVGAAWAADALWTRWQDARAEGERRARGYAALGVLCVLALGHGVLRGAAQVRVYTGTDNRVAAARWLRAHAREGDRVIVEDHPFYSPPLGNEWGEGEEPGARRVPYERLWVGGEDPDAVARWMDGARFVALNGWYLRLATHPDFVRRHPGRAAFYQRVLRQGAPAGYREVARFARGPGFGPWRVDESSSEVLAVAFDHLPMRVYERVAR